MNNARYRTDFKAGTVYEAEVDNFLVCLFFISSNVSFGRDFRSNNANHRLVEKVYEVYGTRVVVAIYYGGFLVENDEIIKNPLSMVRLGRKGEG